MKNQVQEILENNGLDFQIKKLPLVAPNGDSSILTPYFGLLNTKSGEIIHTVKKGYHASQNADVVEAVLKGMKPFGDQLKVNMAGSLNGGRKVFIQLGIEGSSKVGDDIVKRNVTIIDSNDGSTGLSVGIGDFTMSCSNQFYHFYKEGMRMRHSVSLEEKIKGIPNLIEIALGESMKMIQTYEKMVNIQFGKKEIANLAQQLINDMVGLDRRASVQEISELSNQRKNSYDALAEAIATETAQKGDNLWGLHSGVTRWTTHSKRAPKRENGRIESSMMSTNYKANHKSLEFMLEHM